MPAAVAAQPLPVTSTPLQAPIADDALPSIVGGNFAALLLGQMSTEAGLGKLGIDAALPADTTQTALDPALLLASIGLSTIPVAPERAPAITEPQLDADGSDRRELSLALAQTPGIDAALPQTPGISLALPQIPGVAQLPAQSGDPATGEVAAQISERAAQPAFLSTTQAEAPAKLAGFETKLAEATQVLSETAPSAQQQANAAQAASTVAANLRHATENARIDTPLRDQAWPAEFGQKVVWLATQDKQSAQITLNPPQLGPIEISLSVKSDQATAVFASGNAEVREAIESALPRLREMLAGVGVELGQTNVSSESFRQQANDSSGNSRGNSGSGNSNTGNGTVARGETMIAGTSMKRGNGLVDTFA